MFKYGRKSVGSAVLLAMLLILFLTTYYLRLDDVVGMFRDDAWYALLAKALATGQGFTLINSPSKGIVPIYPPFYPLILSLVFRIAPQFPENLFFLKSVSIVAMLIGSIFAYIYFVIRDCSKIVAIVLAAVVGLSPSLVFFATSSLMSECVYMMIQLGSIIAIHKSTHTRNSNWSNLLVLLGGLLFSLAFLTRSIAIVFLIGTAIYFVTKRQLKKICLLMLGSIVIAGPWMIYTNLNRPTEVQRSEVNSYVMVPYTEQFWHKVAGDDSFGKISVSELPSRIIENLSTIIFLNMGSVVVLDLGKRQTTYTLLISSIITLLVLLGYIQSFRHKMTAVEVAFPFYLVIVVLWPFDSFRFLLPLTPILLLYLIEGVMFILKLHFLNSVVSPSRQYDKSLNAGLISVAVVLFLIALVGNIQYIVMKSAKVESKLPKYIKIYNEHKSVLDWIRVNIPPNYRIVTENPALIYLYTGNETVTYTQPQKNWDIWKSLRVRYYVQSTVTPSVADQAQSRFYVPYRTNGLLNLSVIDLGPVETRKPWEYRKSNQIRQY